MEIEFSMKYKIWIALFITLVLYSCSDIKSTIIGHINNNIETVGVYNVVKLRHPIIIDGEWNKYQWQSIKSLELNYFMGKISKFKPLVKAKMMYDNNNLYVIFKVEDRYVRCVTNQINGPVCDDSCVEFFFAPDSSSTEKYFNLEINCGGTPLMWYSCIPQKQYTVLIPEDIKNVEIAHSMPLLVLKEIKDSVTWTIEYRIPLSLLEKYAKLTHPDPGVCWKANFYNCASLSSNPHYLTWAHVDNPVPNFHLPQYFGTLKFQ